MINRLRRLLPHAAILICNMYVVFYLIDRVNTAMNFIDNGLTKGLLLALCVIAFVNCRALVRFGTRAQSAPRRAPSDAGRYGARGSDRRYPSRPTSRQPRGYDDGYGARRRSDEPARRYAGDYDSRRMNDRAQRYSQDYDRHRGYDDDRQRARDYDRRRADDWDHFEQRREAKRDYGERTR